MVDRLAEPDTDYFENRRMRPAAGLAEIREALARQVETSLARVIDAEERGDLMAVLGYLNTPIEHDSEGRDLGYDKRSFSRTELRVADSLPVERRTAYLRYRFRFNAYPREHRAGRTPIILAVEPTSVCNIRCVMCFQMDDQLSGRRAMRGFMTIGLYEQIIAEAAEKGVGGIVLASRGEPLLHKQIGEFVRTAKRAGIVDVKLNTNATRLSEQTSRELLDAGLDTLVFSVDSAVKEQFEEIRRGAKFDKIVANIQRFNEIRSNEFPLAPTRTRISMVLMDQSQDGKHAADFWQSLVDEFAIRWAIPRLGIYDQPSRSETRPCSLLWERLYVWWDGIVNTCDEDYLSRLRIGQLVEGDSPTIEELWTGSRLARYREMHVARRKNELSPCGNCPGF